MDTDTGSEPQLWSGPDVAQLLTLVDTERRYYQEIVSTIPVGVLILSPDLGILSSNREARKTFGARAGKPLQGGLGEFLSPRVVEAARAVVKTGVPETGLLISVPGEPSRNLCLSIRPLRNRGDDPSQEVLLTAEVIGAANANGGHPSGLDPSVAGSADGVPARELLDSLDAIVWAVELPGKRFVFVNENAQEILGYPAETWLDTPSFWSDRIHPDDRAWVLPAYEQSIRDWSRHSCEYRSISSFGKVIWLRETARLLQDGEGRARHLLGFAVDVTERHLVESQFVQSQRREAVSRLAARVAGEISDQVHIIGAHAESLREVSAATGRLRGLAAQLSAYSGQTEASDRAATATPVPVELTDLLTKLGPEIEASLGEGLRFELKLFPAPIGITVDPRQFKQAILTLAERSRRNLEGGGELTLECSPMEIDEAPRPWQRVLAPGVYAVITLTDDGHPLNPQARAALFESFLPHGDPGHDPGPELARIHGLIRQWGGDILADPDLSSGNAFRIFLPRVGENIGVPAAAPQLPDHAVVSAPTACTILVIERDSGIRTLIQKILQRQGYSVMDSAEVDSALAWCEEGPGKVDLLIADIGSQEMASPETTERLRKACPNVKVLYLCGHQDGPAITRRAAPATSFLVKPFTLGALIVKIKEMLAG